MQGDALKRLARVCELSKLDLSKEAVYLQASNKRIISHYVGAYSSAFRIEKEAAGDMSIQVSAQHLRDAVSLFEDDEKVTLVEKGSSLAISAAKSEMRLAQIPGEPRRFRRAKDVQTTAIVSGKDLLSEITLASKFIAKSFVTPILNGIHIWTGKKRIYIEACDGFSVLFRTSVAAKIQAEADVVVSAGDFMVGLQILMDGADTSLELCITDNKVRAFGESGGFDCLTLNGVWPNMPANLSRDPEAQELRMTGLTLKRAVASAKLLNAGSSLTFSPRKRGTSIDAASDEGSFSSLIEGVVESKVTYDLGALALVAEISGDLIMQASPVRPLRVEQPPRVAWVLEVLD